MNNVFKIYGTSSCGFCTAAKKLLESSNFNIEYIDIAAAGMDREEIAKIIGQPFQSVPQIMHGDTYIGGYNELVTYLKSDV